MLFKFSVSLVGVCIISKCVDVCYCYLIVFYMCDCSLGVVVVSEVE